MNIPVIRFTKIYDYAHFSFSGDITITITASEPITSYQASPLAYNIKATVNGNKLTFHLKQSRYLIIKINSLRYIAVAADALETDVPASSGKGIYNITDASFNADATGTTISTDAIQKAIDNANTAGGGIVYVPKGVFLSGNIVLKSNVSLYLAAGSVIRGTGKKADYKATFYKNSLRDSGTYFITTTPYSSHIKIYG